MVIWYILPCFGILYQEKSGNPLVPKYVVCAQNILRSGVNIFLLKFGKNQVLCQKGWLPPFMQISCQFPDKPKNIDSG
jgi:hypothetical protein